MVTRTKSLLALSALTVFGCASIHGMDDNENPKTSKKRFPWKRRSHATEEKESEIYLKEIEKNINGLKRENESLKKEKANTEKVLKSLLPKENTAHEDSEDSPELLDKTKALENNQKLAALVLLAKTVDDYAPKGISYLEENNWISEKTANKAHVATRPTIISLLSATGYISALLPGPVALGIAGTTGAYYVAKNVYNRYYPSERKPMTINDFKTVAPAA